MSEHKMNAIRSLHWRMLDDSRFLLRWLAPRFPKLSQVGVGSRWLGHVALGNAHYWTLVPALFWLLGLRSGLYASLLLVGAFETWFFWVLSRGRGSIIHGWRLWFRVRRSLPQEYHEGASKSEKIQSPYGGENRIGDRPVADHPKMSLLPRIEWPVVSGWIGHPPGRPPSALIDLVTTLTANILRVDRIEIEFARRRDSYGRIRITFVDVLADTVGPVDAPLPPGVVPLDSKRVS